MTVADLQTRFGSYDIFLSFQGPRTALYNCAVYTKVATPYVGKTKSQLVEIEIGVMGLIGFTPPPAITIKDLLCYLTHSILVKVENTVVMDEYFDPEE